MPDKPTIPEVIERFRAYRKKPGNAAWGSLHLVLDDGNTEDYFVRRSISWAEECGDLEGAELARLLLLMSRTQRSKLARISVTSRQSPPADRSDAPAAPPGLPPSPHP